MAHKFSFQLLHIGFILLLKISRCFPHLLHLFFRIYFVWPVVECSSIWILPVVLFSKFTLTRLLLKGLCNTINFNTNTLVESENIVGSLLASSLIWVVCNLVLVRMLQMLGLIHWPLKIFQAWNWKFAFYI